MMTNLISGYVPGRITLLCLNLHLKPRPIWMSRHGESEFNMQVATPAHVVQTLPTF